MVDCEKLRAAIRRFESSSKPSSSSDTREATLADLNKIRKSIIEVLTAFVNELERE